MATLIRNGHPIDDSYTLVADDAALPQGPVIVSLKRLRAEGEALFARNTAVGVRLASDQSPETIGSDLERLSLVVLEFPKFRDGRAFSWARMLRTRLRFQGEIRATGDYLYDQVNYMVRVGFDAFELPPNIEAEDFQRALGEMTYVYQPSSDGRKTIKQLRDALR